MKKMLIVNLFVLNSIVIYALDPVVNVSAVNTADTWSAYLLPVIIVIISGLFIIIWYIRRISKQNAELKSQANKLINDLQSAMHEIGRSREQLIESEKMAALGRLVAGVVHELNTPVGIAVTASTGLLDDTRKMAELFTKDKISRAGFKDYLNTANQAAQLILSNMEKTALIAQSFKQISIDQSQETKRSFNLKDYITDIVRSLYPRFKNRKISIDVDMDDGIILESYPGAFSQIFTNLIINSLVHAFNEDQEGKINIGATSEDGHLVLHYKDNGKGISQENLKRVYDAFFTTNDKAGTGLGMHIVYKLVTQKLNGSIECESEVGEGVHFIMTLKKE